MLNQYKKQFSAPLIFIVIAVLFFAIITFSFTFMNNSKVDYIQNEIKEIKKEVIQIENNNLKLDKKFDNFKNQIKDIDNNIERNNNSILKLKTNEKKTIDSFRNYTPNEWERFFTERYK